MLDLAFLAIIFCICILDQDHLKNVFILKCNFLYKHQDYLLQRQRQAEEAAKKAEVEALQQQIAQMKALQSNLPGGQKKAPGNKVSVEGVDEGVVCPLVDTLY